jgi:hypothetical protein
MASMKQRRPKPRKSKKPSVPSPSAYQPVVEGPLRRKAHPARSEITEPILPPSEAPDQAEFKGEGGLRADATAFRAEQHAEMLSRIAVVEALIAELPKQPIDIGHNRQLITEDEVQEIKEAIAVLKSQPVVPTAPDKARAAGSTLKKIKERLGTYLDAFMLEASKSAGKELIKQLGKFSRWWLLLDALTKLAQSVFNWLH